MRSLVRIALLWILLLCLQLDLMAYYNRSIPWCGWSVYAQNPQLRDPMVAENWLAIVGFAASGGVGGLVVAVTVVEERRLVMLGIIPVRATRSCCSG